MLNTLTNSAGVENTPAEFFLKVTAILKLKVTANLNLKVTANLKLAVTLIF